MEVAAPVELAGLCLVLARASEELTGPRVVVDVAALSDLARSCIVKILIAANTGT